MDRTLLVVLTSRNVRPTLRHCQSFSINESSPNDVFDLQREAEQLDITAPTSISSKPCPTLATTTTNATYGEKRRMNDKP